MNKNRFYVIVVGLSLFGLIAAVLMITKTNAHQPPVLGTLPAFTLIDQEGQAFSSDDLRGKVTVVNFIFTSCPSYCPILTQSMVSLQQRFKASGIDMRMVSISVDPQTDQPAVLKSYAQKYGADLSSWSFVTGSLDMIKTLVVDGFKVHMGEKEYVSDSLYDIAHSVQFVLLDQSARIRGYFRIDESDTTPADEVFLVAQVLLKE